MAGALPKLPAARVRYAIAWPARVRACGTEWTVTPAEPGGLAVEPEPPGEDGTACAVLAGGIAGRRYRVTARAGGLARTLDLVGGGL